MLTRAQRAVEPVAPLRSAARRLAVLGLLVALAACDEGGSAVSENTFAQGREVFRRCTACHVTTAEENKVGPHLLGLFGRVAGSVEGFRYSEVMRTSGVVWTDETLRSFLRNPRSDMPGNRMAFPGIRRDEDLTALIDYLRRVTALD